MSAAEAEQIALNAYYIQARDLLNTYRDGGVNNIPIADWFKQRIPDPDDYAFWAEWEYKHEDFNVSDKHFATLGSADRIAFIHREDRRTRTGLWAETPRFKAMKAGDRERLRYENPLAGFVQLLTGSHYYQLNYPELLGVGKAAIIPFYHRKSAQFFDILEALDQYPLAQGEDREGLIVPKARGVHFSANMTCFMIRRMRTLRGTMMYYAMDKDDKVNVPLKNFTEIYSRSPKWWKPTYFNVNTKKEKELFDIPDPNKRTHNPKESILMEFANAERNGINTSYSNVVHVSGPKPSRPEGSRYDMAFTDEASLMEYSLADHRDSLKPCMQGPNENIIGMHVMGGTASPKMQHALPVYAAMARNPAVYNYATFFIGRQNSTKYLNSTGWPDEARAIAEVQAKRERLREIGDEDGLINDRCINPIDMEDCFYQAGTRGTPTERIDARIAIIRSIAISPQRDTVKVERIEFGFEPGDVYPTPKVSSNGGWYVLEHPAKEIYTAYHENRISHLYAAGSDNVDGDVREGIDPQKSSLSQQAAVMLNNTNGMVAAFYHHRNRNRLIDFSQKLMGYMYWNCQALIEKNKPGEVLFCKQDAVANVNLPFRNVWLQLRQMGIASADPYYFKRYCAKTPDNFGKHSTTERIGIDTEGGNKIILFEELLEWIDEYLDTVNAEGVLQAIRRWNVTDDYSPDLGMALMIAVKQFRQKRPLAMHAKDSLPVQAYYEAFTQALQRRGVPMRVRY